MSLLEELELEKPDLIPALESKSPPAPTRPSFFRRFLWSGFLSLFLSFTLSAGVCGLHAVKNQLFNSWQTSLANLKWLVLVDGDQVMVDEVGRYLKQIDGVNEVTFVNSDQIMERLKNDTMLKDNLSTLDANPLPPCWQVSWFPDAVQFARMKEVVQDIRGFPGVLDVAVDQQLIGRIHEWRLHWYEVRLILSLVLFGAAGLGILLLGRFLFFRKEAVFNGKMFALTLVTDTIGWSAGFFSLWRLVGELPWFLLAGGAAVSLYRLVWFDGGKRA